MASRFPVRNYRRFPGRRAYRPSEPHQRVQNVDLEANENYAQLLYTASDPVTVKNIRLNIAAQNSVPYALVVVQDSYAPQQLTYPALAANMYEPSQNVLVSGLITSNDVVIRRGLNRRLRPGDMLWLVARNPTAGTPGFRYEVSFTTFH